MTAQRDANITLDSIWNGKWEIPGSQSGFFHGTPSLVGLLTQKLRRSCTNLDFMIQDGSRERKQE